MLTNEIIVQIEHSVDGGLFSHLSLVMSHEWIVHLVTIMIQWKKRGNDKNKYHINRNQWPNKHLCDRESRQTNKPKHYSKVLLDPTSLELNINNSQKYSHMSQFMSNCKGGRQAIILNNSTRVWLTHCA